MELTKNKYYKFLEHGFKFWYRQTNYSENKLCKADYLSFELNDKHALKLIDRFERWGIEELWFDYYDPSTGDIHTGEIGYFLTEQRTEGLSEYFTPFTTVDFLPASLISDLEEVLDVIDNAQSKQFAKSFRNYHLGDDTSISFSLGLNEELEESEQEVDVPEFTFEVTLKKEQFKFSAYLQDANWGDPYIVDITFEMESPNIENTNWDKEKALLIDRIMLYKSQLSFTVDNTIV